MNDARSFMRYLSGYVKLVMHSLLHRKLRAGLTVVGIVIGISIVLTLVFLGNGLQRSIVGQLQQFGGDLIFMLPRDAADPFAGATAGGEFTDDDVRAAEDVDGVLAVMPIVASHLMTAEFRGEEKTVAVEARPRELIQDFLVESLGITVGEGRWMAREDAREVVLGSNIAANGFREPVRVGDTVDLGGRRLAVVGILQPFGDRVRDNIVLVTVETFQTLTGIRDSYDGMLAKVEQGRDIEAIGDDLRYTLSLQDDLEEFTVLTPDKAEEVISGVIGTVQAALFLIASVAVLVAGIGVMNTMYTSVLERSREIGVMKAVGARDWHVMVVFLIEAMLLGIIGGALGIIGGAGLAEIVAALARARGFDFFETAVDLDVVVFVLAFTMIVGLIAGVLPAREAAKKRPVEALRYR